MTTQKTNFQTIFLSANMITVDSIIQDMKTWVENDQIVHPSVWLDQCIKLNVLIGGEHAKLITLESEIARQRYTLLKDQNCPVSRAKAIIEAEPIYAQYRTQKAKITQIEEFIKIAKKYASLKDDELRNQL